MLKDSLPRAVKLLGQQELVINEETVKFWIQEANVSRPSVGRRDTAEATRSVFPAECRERRITYQADLQLNIQVQVGEGLPWTITRIVGQIPIMVKSDRCYLKGMSPADLIQHHEEAEVYRMRLSKVFVTP